MTDNNPSLAAVKGGVIPYLMVDGAVKTAEFYGKAFGAEIVAVHPPAEDGRTTHVHLHINGSSVMLSDPYPEQGAPLKAPQGYHLMLEVDDVEFWRKRAIDAGADPVSPPADMFWAARHAMLRDPAGVTWGINQPLG
jgi:uncharacterized glyoxalase superfamily protein PhnB